MKAPYTSLGDVLTRIKRQVEVNSEAQYAEVGVYCFGCGLFHKQPRSGLEVGDKALFLIEKGDFILQATFAWEGVVAVAAEKEDGMFGSVRVLTFDTDRSKCNPKYVQLYLSTPHGREQLLRISPGSAGRNGVLNVKRLSEVAIPLPALDQQDQLVGQIEVIGGHLADALRLRQGIVDDGKALRHSVFHRLIKGAPFRPLAEVAPIVRRPVGIDLDSTYQEIGIRSFQRAFLTPRRQARQSICEAAPDCAALHPGYREVATHASQAQPRRGVTYQPRATPWVGSRIEFSPEGA